jgi:hypothetical protein
MSFNISVPEELIQDVSDQNVIVSGHSQLVDVSCQHLDVSGNATLDGTLNVIGTLDVGGHTQLVDVSCTTLEVGGDTTLDGTLSVGGTLNVGGFPIYNMVSYYNTILSPSNLYHSSVSAQFTYNTLTLTPKSLNSILYISSSGTFEKNGAPYDSYFNIYLNIDGTDIAQIAGAVTYRIAGNARQHVSGSVFYTPNTTNQISITNNVHPAASPTFYIRAYHLNVIEYLI